MNEVARIRRQLNKMKIIYLPNASQ